MVAFVDRHVGSGSPSQRLHALMDGLFERRHLDVSYSNVETTAAAETFSNRTGNCLSFTLMFAALARHAGLEVRFREVGEVLSWDQRGAVLLNNKHLFTEVPVEGGRVAVDFIPGADKRYRLVRDADEARVLAHFYSNLGAESLAAGDSGRARAYLERAVEVDPTFGWAWSNLGVVHRVLGHPERAEECYLEAHRLDPADTTPLSNLASLYGALDQPHKARRYARRVEAHRRRNPFHHYRLSLIASASGDIGLAIEHMRRAVRRAPDDPRLWSGLGELQLDAGKPQRAGRSLERALRHARDDQERRELERRLEAIREPDAGAGSGDG